MPYQTGRNVVVAYKANAGAYGTPAVVGSGATGFRPVTGGLNLTKQAIPSNENRRDGMRTRGRHGQRAVAGSYQAELSIGTFDALFEAALRGTWSAAATITQASVSSATLSVQADGFTISTGSWITAGIRVGQVVRFTAGVASGNQIPCRVVGLTATKITVAETLSVEAGPISTWSVTRGKTLIQPSTPVNRDFSFEEYEVDIDQSERFDGVRVGGFSLEMRPDNLINVTFNMVGQDGEVLATGSSPYFTSPTFSTTLPLSVVDAGLRLGSKNIVDLTGFTLGFDLSAQPVSVAASNVTPDVFTNLATVTAEITALREDLADVSRFLDETQLALHLLCGIPGTNDYWALALTNLTLGGATKSALGQDGPRTQTLPLVVGIDEAGGAFDPTMLRLSTSAA
ncbi:MAG TPA: phage tail tube protein [Roseococcus sp.]|jgi:hypothetical protein|nr:phage tail tube protein [Roseococcus sp.]